MADEGFDWIERICRGAAYLGLNETRLRWKLINLKQGVENRISYWTRKWETSAYQHKVCPNCGRINDGEEVECGNCSAQLESRSFSFLRKMGLDFSSTLSIASFFGFLILCVYIRMLCSVPPGEGLTGWSLETLSRFGANIPLRVIAGEWWRLGTAIFIHIGLFHLAFNLYALSLVGPLIEDTFGWSKSVFIFMSSGIVANLARVCVGGFCISAGASGALMGLLGTAAAWGQKEGSSVGRGVRDFMIRWAIYTMIFGLLVNGDNVAHGAGFFFGAILGYLFHSDTLRSSRGVDASFLEELLALIAVATALLAVLISSAPPDVFFSYLGY